MGSESLREVAQFWAHGQDDGGCDAARLAHDWLRLRVRLAEMERERDEARAKSAID